MIVTVFQPGVAAKTAAMKQPSTLHEPPKQITFDNPHMRLQAINMLNLLDAFKSECRLAATKDDGKVSEDEQACLARIDLAVAKFSAEINSML